MSINNINATDISKLTSGQVIIDLKSIVKEAIENSIDAQSTKIEVNFANYGLDQVTVLDNGNGIKPQDFESVCLRNHTSKLETLGDLGRITTLGFRGEALNSMCCLADLTIVTSSQFPLVHELKFSSLGLLQSETKKPPTELSTKGTKLIISGLFKGFPVRLKNFQRNLKSEFNKTISLLTQYLIMYPEIKFNITNTKNGKKSIIYSTKGGLKNSLLDNMITIYGTSGARGLLPLELEVNRDIKVEGYISNYSFGLGRNVRDRQFIYINKRPVIFKKLAKIVNEVFQSFNHVQYPAFVINLCIKPEILDLNLLPDKSMVFIHDEMKTIDSIRDKLTEYYESQDNYLYPKNSSDTQRSQQKPPQSIKESISHRKSLPPRTDAKISVQDSDSSEKTSSTDDFEDRDDDMVQGRSKETPEEETLALDGHGSSNISREDPFSQLITQPIDTQVNLPSVDITTSEPSCLSESSLFVSDETKNNTEVDISVTNDKVFHADITTESISLRSPILDSANEEDDSILIDEVSTNNMIKESTTLGSKNPETGPRYTSNNTDNRSMLTEKGRACKKHRISGPIESRNISDFKYNDPKKKVASGKHIDDPYGKNFFPAQNSNDLVSIKIGDIEVDSKYSRSVTHESLHNTVKRLSGQKFKKLEIDKLSKTTNEVVLDDVASENQETNLSSYIISKSDFERMHVIGQFNLGFILVKQETEDQTNIFIIDQHASDEKFNFEKLNNEFEIAYQTLISPIELELNVVERHIVSEHQEVFRRNGFIVDLNNAENASNQSLFLKTLPVYKSVLFSVDDFYELLDIVSNNPHNKAVKVKRIRNILAMKACRKSVMIGKSLNSNSMEKIVKNLSLLKKPWNCPHGRPTMRHLTQVKWNSSFADYEL